MLKYLFLGLSIIVTCLTYFLLSPSMHIVLYFILCFLASYIIISALYFVLLYLYSLTISKHKEYDKRLKFHYFLLTITIEFVLTFAGVRVKLINKDLIPKDRRFLIIGNHKSNFDPLIVLTQLKAYDLTTVSKDANFKIPIAGAFMRCCSIMPIDRENNRNALRTIVRCINFIEKNIYSVLIYPEGTRNKDEGILPFRAGSLKIAYKTKAPVVIFSMHNTAAIAKRFPRITKVEMRILDVVEYDTYKDMSSIELAKYARDLIKADQGIIESEDVVQVTM